jgi:UDP-N-acetylbacillosamine N-acetyltransferase
MTIVPTVPVRAKLVIWGAGGHALVVADIVREQGQYELVGFLDDRPPGIRPTDLAGTPVLGGGDQLHCLKSRGVTHAIVAVGDARVRLALAEQARQAGLVLAVAVHPRATVAAGVPLGAGTVVAAGAVVNPGVWIHQNVVVNTSSSVDHDCFIDDGAHICPGAHLAGGVRVGRAAWIGIGATVTERVRIGAGSVVGAGAVVLGDVAEGVVAYGVPARVVRPA